MHGVKLGKNGNTIAGWLHFPILSSTFKMNSQPRKWWEGGAIPIPDRNLIYQLHMCRHFSLVQWQHIGVVGEFLIDDSGFHVIRESFEEKSVEKRHEKVLRMRWFTNSPEISLLRQIIFKLSQRWRMSTRNLSEIWHIFVGEIAYNGCCMFSSCWGWWNHWRW